MLSVSPVNVYFAVFRLLALMKTLLLFVISKMCSLQYCYSMLTVNTYPSLQELFTVFEIQYQSLNFIIRYLKCKHYFMNIDKMQICINGYFIQLLVIRHSKINLSSDICRHLN